MWTTVATFREGWEAHMFRSRLWAEGVPAIVIHEYHVGNAWDFSVSLGGVKVQVPRDRFEEARAVERRCQNGEFRALLESELGDLDDVTCPECGSGELRKRRPFLRAAFSILATVWVGRVLAPIGWIYCCKKCHTEFRPARRPHMVRKWVDVLFVIANFLIVMFFVLRWIHKAFGCPVGVECV